VYVGIYNHVRIVPKIIKIGISVNLYN